MRHAPSRVRRRGRGRGTSTGSAPQPSRAEPTLPAGSTPPTALTRTACQSSERTSKQGGRPNPGWLPSPVIKTSALPTTR